MSRHIVLIFLALTLVPFAPSMARITSSTAPGGLPTGSDAIASSDGIVSIQAKRNVFVVGAFLLAGSREAVSATDQTHPIRRLVRDELLRKLDAGYLESLRQYCEQQRLTDVNAISPYSIALPTQEGSEQSADPDTSSLNGRIADFAIRSGIDSLWSLYQGDIMRESEAYRAKAHAAITRITAYLGLDPLYLIMLLDQLHFQFNPLLDFESVQAIRIDNDLYVIAGPSAKGPSESIFFHQLLHFVLGPLTSRHARDIDQSAPLFQLVRSSGLNQEDSWAAVVEESFVRSITAVLAARADGLPDFRTWDVIDREYAGGYLLCPFIHYRLLERGPGNDPSFSDWYRQTLSAVDLEREQARFREFLEKDTP